MKTAGMKQVCRHGRDLRPRSGARRCRFWLALLAVAVATPAAAQSIGLAPAGPSFVIYHSVGNSCGREFIPDAPARAFKRADGKVEFFATSDINWYMLGNSLLSLRSACQTALLPQQYAPRNDRQLWIEGTYTNDGKSVVALLSEDLTNSARQRGCDMHLFPGHCWLNNILAATSADMGASFQPVPGEQGLIASLAASYDDSYRSRVGYFTTSNVVRTDGYYYFIAYAQTADLKADGNRLLRTANFTDPTSWRAWDGTGFAAIPRAGAGGPPAAVIGPRSFMSEVRSITYLPRASSWIAVFIGRARLKGDAAAVPGIYMATSKDLLNWGPPSRVLATPLRPTDGVNVLTGYPSLLDPASRSRNFETIDGSHPLLTYTVTHPGLPGGIYNREIIGVPLRILLAGPWKQ